MASTEQRELQLVGTVQLRIASAKDDKALKNNLDKYLVPLLLKLASPHIAVRNEVIKVCRFVDTLLAPTGFELPLKDLLTQFRDVSKDLVRLFDLRYIKLGLERIPETRRREYFPQVIQGLYAVYSASPAQASGLFSLFVRLLLYVPLPPRASQDDLNLREKFGLVDDDAVFLSQWLGKLLLYQGPTAESQASLTKADLEFFSFNDESFWRAPGRPNGAVNLTEVKIIAAKFLASGVFNDSERLIPAVIAAADTNSRISDTGIDMLKRCLAVSDLEAETPVTRLFALYLGSPPASTSARPPLKIRILNVLSKSALAAKHNDAEKIVKDALDPETSGLEGSKLRTAAFAFVNWITRMSEGAIDTAPLIEETKLLIEGQGWPEVAKSGSTQGDVAIAEARGKAYETLGLLIRTKTKSTGASQLSADLHPVKLIRWLFTSLLEDTSGNEMSLSIESAISNTLIAISTVTLNLEEETVLLDTLSAFIRTKTEGQGQPRTAYPALRFVNQCFPFNNSKARCLNVLAMATGGLRRELEEEAKGGLDPFIHSKSYRQSNFDVVEQIQLPNFSSLCNDLLIDMTDDLKQWPEAKAQAISFCKAVLFHQALASQDKAPVIDDRWRMNIDSALTNDEQAIGALETFLKTAFAGDASTAKPLKELLLQAYLHTVDKHSSSIAAVLLELVRFAPPDTLGKLPALSVEKDMQAVLASTDHSLRRTGARCFGILASQYSINASDTAQPSAHFWKILDSQTTRTGSEAYKNQGALLGLGSWLARLDYRVRSATEANVKITSLDSEDLSAQLGKLHSVCFEVFKHKEDRDSWEAAVAVLLELIRFGCSPELTSFALEEENSDVVTGLVTMAKRGHSNSVTLLGLLSFLPTADLAEGSPIHTLVEKLNSLHEEKKPELQFEVGQALSLVAFGQESKALIGSIDVPGSALSSPPRVLAGGLVFDKALAACKHTKPSLRQAGAIWLLCLLQYGGHTTFMQSKLGTCQLAFKALLGDKDSLNQESAASGLTLVYEQGDQAIKDQLVKDLVGSFISSEPTNLSGQVSEDTTLFDEGALPTGEGKSVTTYGDIMKLAREVGDDGLVYRFMNLAKNSSVWTSRAAFGRFGLSRVLSDASEDGYLSQNPKLYRALYRYRFDPNPNVQSAMNDIWTALVKDPSKIVSQFFDDILQDLLKHMTDGKEWRARQASCAALADLIQGRPLEKYEQYLNDVWSQAFKLTDDQKGSVREEAGRLVRVLTTIVKRTLEAGESSAKNATNMLTQVLPFLLGDNGMNSTVKEQQAYALKTITDLVKAGSAIALRPFLPDIICGLLEQLSALEPEAANYIHLNADKYGITTQQLDDLRMTSVGRSPMMEAVERCIDHLDEASVEKLRPQLIDTIKSRAIGLPSRVGVSRALISLATRRNFLFRKYSSEFLIVLRNKFVVDRNDTISTSAATACGYLARIASDEKILKTVEWSQKQFFTEEDERKRVIAGEMMLSIGKYAADRFKDLSGNILPFIFLAKHDTYEASGDLFKATWDENVSGPRVVLLYLKEILALCDQHLDSARWPIKHASAFAIADAVQAAGIDMDEPTARTLWPSVEKAIGGKTWEGKEKVLDAFVFLVKHSPLLKTDDKISSQMQKIIIREAKRNNATYQEHSIAALGDCIPVCASVAWFEQTHEIIEPLLDQLLEGLNEKMDVDTPQSSAASSRVVTLRTMANALKTLFVAIDPSHHQGGELKADMEKVLALAKKALSEKDRSIVEALLDGEKGLFEKLQKPEGPLDDKTLQQHAELIFEQEDYPEPTRLKGAEAGVQLARLVKERHGLRGELKAKMEAVMGKDRANAVKQMWAKALAEL